MKTTKNPYDQLVNNAINSQQEIHSKENSPESIHSPEGTFPATEDPSTSDPSEGGSLPTRENSQSVKMDAEMLMEADMNSSQILEEVGSMERWSKGLNEWVGRREEEDGRKLRTGEVEVASGAERINLKDS